MPQALRAVEVAVHSFAEPPQDTDMETAAVAAVEFRHVRGAADCVYLVEAFGDELLMQMQLNVWRLVIVYRVPAVDGVDGAALAPRLERWQIGAENAGWTIGWRDTANPRDRNERYVETYCYATARRDLLSDPLEQLYWRTDIVQMTRYFMLEAVRCGLTLSPRRAGYAI